MTLHIIDPKQGGVTEALRQQNEGQSWRDCSDAGLPHLWQRGTITADATYWACARCPVNTRTSHPRDERPSAA